MAPAQRRLSGQPPVLVTGAAGGTQGATGRKVVELLLQRGQQVRAFVHTDDARADELRGLGAQVAVGDLREIADVRPAVGGVHRAFFTYPVTDGLLDATGAFAAAAREAGLERVVEVSQLAAAPDAGTPRMRQHWVSEQVFDRSGIGAVHLRGAVFYENLALLVAVGGLQELALPLGSRNTVLPLVAGSDVARVAANLLLDPGPAEPVCRLTGQVSTVGEIVETFGAALGHEVRYIDMPGEDWQQQASAVGYDPHAVAHLTKLWELFRLIGSDHPLYHVTETIEQIGGAPPRSLRDYLDALYRPGGMG
jgi:uncharacterized protein YbjT (DUF2867 family)